MRVQGLKTIRTAARWARARLVGRGVILGYHRVAADEWDPYGLNVHPERFEEHLRYLREHANPVRLAELVAGLDGRRTLPPRAVAVTFDDGYLDNLTVALPLLERYGIPASVLVISGALGRELWWDELARRCGPGRRLPRSVQWMRDGELRYRLPPASGGARLRQRFVISLQRELMAASPDELHQVLQSLGDGGGEVSALPAHPTMAEAEVAKLDRSLLIEIGSHSLLHPVLAKLPEVAQKREVQGSKRMLEALLGHRVDAFSYPNGSSPSGVARIVRRSGYRYACTSRSDVLSARSDRYRLPRFWAPDRGGQTFWRWLRPWLV